MNDLHTHARILITNGFSFRTHRMFTASQKELKVWLTKIHD